MNIYSDAKAMIGDIIALAKKARSLDMLKLANKLEERLLDGERESRAKDRKIEQLEEALKFRESFTYRDNAYWTPKKDSPYCSGCWDNRKKAIRLARKGSMHECPVCKSSFLLSKSGT